MDDHLRLNDTRAELAIFIHEIPIPLAEEAEFERRLRLAENALARRPNPAAQGEKGFSVF